MAPITLRFCRYFTAQEFARELATLKAYRGDFVGDRLLERLEAAGLVTPRLRLRYPDPVARRFWAEAHEGIQPRGALEPDGPVWDAAVALETALHRWCHHTVYGPSTHPFDSPAPEVAAFLMRPPYPPFQPWLERRVDVSNDVYPTLLDDGNHESFYSTWQLLLAAEVADSGVHYLLNLHDEAVRQKAWEAVREGRAPGESASFALLPAHSMRGFVQHEAALDAVVWFEEETQRALNAIAKDVPGRSRLSEAQNAEFLAARRAAADAAVSRFAVDSPALLELCRFLADRWTDWNGDGRPLIAAAYKAFLGRAVVMLRVREGLNFAEVRDRVGQVGGWFKPILEVIWPDWLADEKERVRRTLTARIGQSPSGDLSASDVERFVAFLADEKLEGFFWRLRSLEDHAFGGNDFALEGMQSDLQGMAVAVEHVARALGGDAKTLYELFKQLWRGSGVLPVLKDCAQLARRENTPANWAALKDELATLRGRGQAGNIAADLLLASRIRGDVHRLLPEGDELVLEELVVAVMRAAALTFARVRRPDAGALASSIAA